MVHLRRLGERQGAAGVHQQVVARRGEEDRAVTERLPFFGFLDSQGRGFAEDRCRFRVGLLAGFDSGSYDEQAVQADALDGPTLEGGAVFEWHLGSHVRLFGGGSYGYMFPRQVRDSVYRPEFAVNCAQALGALPACAEANSGRGIATANGDYDLRSYTASLGIAFDWWPE